MAHLLNEVCLARIPRAALPLLGPLRARRDVLVTCVKDEAWLEWPAGDDEVLGYVLPVTGANLYYRGEENRGEESWFALGCRLPVGTVPELASRPLGDVLLPSPVHPAQTGTGRLNYARLRLQPSPIARRTSAVRLDLATLAAWAEEQPQARLQQFQAARIGKEVLLLGAGVPLLPDGQRYWGTRLLVPLGLAPVPAFSEAVLCQALDLAEDELMLLSESGAEAIPLDSFATLARSSLRLAMRQEGAWTQ